MKSWIFGFIVGLIIIPVLAYMYLALGQAPVATSAAPLPLERFVTQKALHAVIDKNAPKNSPVQATEASLLAGVKYYRFDCAVCHGLPGQTKTDIAKGEFPKPPQLFEGKGVTDDPAGETFWKVKNGIRLTGMPSFEGSLTDEQMWQVSVMLAAEKLPDTVMQELRKPDQAIRP